jgi:signal transduction histidine kinase
MRKVEILLALSEEDPHRLMALGLALETMGYQVTIAKTDLSAIEMFYTKKIDLVITDHLPVLEKTKEMNSESMTIFLLHHHWKSLPPAHGFRFDPDDYLFRPIQLDELEMRVKRCIKKWEPKRNLNEKVLNMLKMMSHDLRGSLISISATLKLLIRGSYGKMEDTAANRLKELFSKTNGLIGTTDEFLNRTISVREDAEREGKDLDLMQDIIHPVLEELSSELKNHPLLIDHSFTARRVSLKAGWIWLKTVFRNLLENATKYGEKGCTIALGFEEQDSCCRLNVYNSGKPIPEEWRDKLFSEFVRIGENRHADEAAEGAGVGLYLIKEMIRKQGGDIWYEAKEDGSNFVFTLPSDSLLAIRSTPDVKKDEKNGLPYFS